MPMSLIEAAEKTIIPRMEQLGGKLETRTESEISFVMNGIKLSIWLERDCLIYSSLKSIKTDRKVDISEVLIAVTKKHTQISYWLSERYPVDKALIELTSIIIAKLLPILNDFNIEDIIDLIEIKRESSLQNYYDNILGEKALQAFKDKKYKDVIKFYSQMQNLSEVQRRRFEIAQKRF